MSNEQVIENKKKLLKFWQEEARKRGGDYNKAVQKANALQREVYELQNPTQKTQSSRS